jgi:hypothetical protein
VSLFPSSLPLLPRLTTQAVILLICLFYGVQIIIAFLCCPKDMLHSFTVFIPLTWIGATAVLPIYTVARAAKALKMLHDVSGLEVYKAMWGVFMSFALVGVVRTQWFVFVFTFEQGRWPRGDM